MNVACPLCGFADVGEVECPRCGIVFAKWRARKAAEGEKPASGAALSKAAENPRKAAEIRSTRRAVSARAFAGFCKQMSALLQSGVSMQEALGIVGGAAAQRVIRRACARVKDELRLGATFGAAVDVARFVDREVVALLSAAETIGNLPATFAEIASDVDQRMAFRRAIVMGLAYPAILVVLAIFSLPLKVLVFEGPARYFAETLPPFGGLVGAVVFVTAILPRILGLLGAPNALRDAVSAIPLLGRPWRALSVARFARSLGRFLEAGVEIGEALKNAAASTGQRRIVRGVDGAAQKIAAGATLAVALAETGLFGADFNLAVDGAERSGRLGPTLLGIARSYEDAALHQVRLTLIIGTTLAAVAVMAFIGLRLFSEMQGTVKGVKGVIDSVLNEAGDVQRGVEKSFEQLDKLLDQ